MQKLAWLIKVGSSSASTHLEKIASLHAGNRVWHAIVLICLLVFKIAKQGEDCCVPPEHAARPGSKLPQIVIMRSPEILKESTNRQEINARMLRNNEPEC